jgi:hypothetical protein
VDDVSILGTIAGAISWIASLAPLAVVILAAFAVRTLLLLNTMFKLRIDQLRMETLRQDAADEVTR